jgi:hypothetical protein
MVALWAVMDTLHDIQADNQCHCDFMIHNVMRLILESTMVMGLAMKEWSRYIVEKSAKKERRREGGVDEGEGAGGAVDISENAA